MPSTLNYVDSGALLSGRLGSFLGQTVGTDGAESSGFDWGNLALGLAAGQALVSGIDAWAENRQTALSLDLKSSTSAVNAQIAEMGAQQALRAGAQQVAQITQRAGQLKARQRAGFAASGVAVGVGSSAETMATTDIMKEVDAQTAKVNALQSAWGYRRQAIMLDAQSKASKIMASANRSAAPWNGLSSILGGAAKVAGFYYQMGK